MCLSCVKWGSVFSRYYELNTGVDTNLIGSFSKFLRAMCCVRRTQRLSAYIAQGVVDARSQQIPFLGEGFSPLSSTGINGPIQVHTQLVFCSILTNRL